MAAIIRPSVERCDNALGSRQQACNSLSYSSDGRTEKGVGAHPCLKKALPEADTSPSGSSNCSCLKAIHMTSRIEPSKDSPTAPCEENEPVSEAWEDCPSSSSLN
ncbi:hypothetical protein CHARACLAT_020773 [Characodon lateralis]|uniref:Uncharacterized protein n=1 Tax=Characodon lateralis TaxID=208331 RepID=A0ABU7E283_9TELE|nr:hypothetical protein [Characodon lateralis]